MKAVEIKNIIESAEDENDRKWVDFAKRSTTDRLKYIQTMLNGLSRSIDKTISGMSQSNLTTRKEISDFAAPIYRDMSDAEGISVLLKQAADGISK